MIARSQLASIRRRSADDDKPTAVIETIRSLVREPALVVNVATPLAEVRRLLVEHRVPAVVVLDRDDKLRGVVTRTDVLRCDDAVTAGEAMSSFVLVLVATASIVRAAGLISYEHVGFVVVCAHGGELIGLVSAVDLVRHFALKTRRKERRLSPG